MAGFKILKIAAFAAFYIAVFGTLVVALWNWLMPNLFGLPTISFTQALGLFVLCRILTGGFRLSSLHGGGGNWAEKQELFDNWKNMSPDERERMKQEWKTDWRERCKDRRPIGFNRPNCGEPNAENKKETNAPTQPKPKDLI
jgi:hypothetical protein